MNVVARNLPLRAAACIVVLLIFSGHSFAAPTVWTGPTISFTRSSGVDFTLPQNQDHVTPSVAFTRGNTQGLFNIAQEASFNATSPAGTLWATDLNNPSQTITATNFAALSFTTWSAAYNNSISTTILNRNAVVRLVSDDVYLNVKFTSFQSGSGGGFSYERSTHVPEPAMLILVLSLLAASVGSRLRWQSGRQSVAARQWRETGQANRGHPNEVPNAKFSFS